MKTPLIASLAIMLAGGLLPLHAVEPGLEPPIEPGFAKDKLYSFDSIESIDLSSGALSLRIPIGISYSVGGSLSYALTLQYGSLVWDLESYEDPERPCVYYTRAYPSKSSNAGLGWSLSLGRLYDPQDTEYNPQYGFWVYSSPDGAQHRFWPLMHKSDAVSLSEGYFLMYARDSSYIRLKICDDDSACNYDPDIYVELPDGTVYTFEEFELHRWRVKTIHDPYGNEVSISYGTYGQADYPMWTIDDSHRTHKVYFLPKWLEDVRVYYVDRVVLAAFGGAEATYQLNYSNPNPDPQGNPTPNIHRSCQDNDIDGTEDYLYAPLLTSIDLPDGSSFIMEYYFECDTAKDQPGVIQKLILPTKGGFEWTYQDFEYSAHAMELGCTPNPPCITCKSEANTVNAGVHTKTVFGIDGLAQERTWTYRTWVGWTPTAGLVLPPDNPSIPEERRTVVSSPEGNDTVYYFRANPSHYNSVADEYLHFWDYGLPYTRRLFDEDGRFLSVEYYEGAIDDIEAETITGNKLRSVYLRYDHDQLTDFGVFGEDAYYRHVNRHLATQRTVYWDELLDDQGTSDPTDDVYRYDEVNNFNFDGLGHYRTTVTDGNFDLGNRGRTDRLYSRSTKSSGTGLGTYNITFDSYAVKDSDVDAYTEFPGAESPKHDFLMPVPVDWILGVYSSGHNWEGDQVLTREYCFDSSSGALLRFRAWSDTGFIPATEPYGSRSPNDILTVYEYNAKGSITDTKLYGGDQQTLGTTTDLCDIDLSTTTTQHHVAADYDSASGVMDSTWYVDENGDPLEFLINDFYIDSSTGLVSTSRSVDGLATDYQFDSMVRLTWIVPSAESGLARTHYEYFNATETSTATVKEYKRQNTVMTVITEQEFVFDRVGRLEKEKRILKDGSWAQRDTEYSSSGWKTAVSEWHDPGAKSITQTVFSDFDPFARPAIVTPPDGASHNIELAYTGIRSTRKTVSIGTSLSDDTVDESDVTTEEIKDRQGRLLKLIERPNDTEEIITTYDYDITGKLAMVTASSNDLSQSRTFTYDGHGLLRSECHPELGSGGGCIYYNEYDATGNVIKKTDGDIVYRYFYDRAKRLTKVQSTRAGTTHTERELFYGIENDGTNRKLGKLERAVAHNHWDPENPSASVPFTETYEYRGKGGAISKRTTEFPLAPNGASISQEFSWNQLGQLETHGYPTLTSSISAYDPDPPERTVAYTYTRGWLSGVVGFTTSMSYHKNGMINHVVHSNGVTDTFAMDDTDNMQRPKSITVSGMTTTPSSWTTGDISYDGAGNITAMGDDWFLYDGLNRLTQAHLADVDKDGIGDAVDIAYRYDPFGNRTDTYWSDTDEQGGLTTSWYTYSVDAATNRLAGETYDSAGNMTSLRGDTFTWYPFNQIQRRTGTGRHYYYGYTVDGERLMTLDVIPDPDHFTITVRDLDGKIIRQFGLEAETGVYSWEKDYIYANGKVIATDEPTYRVRHHHLDHLGTPRVITNTSGNLVAYNAYSPYGIQLTGERGERLKFTGHERNSGDLDYMHARYYSPVLARFLSTDPAVAVGSSQAMNRFSYVNNNPMILVDPTGMYEWASPCNGDPECEKRRKAFRRALSKALKNKDNDVREAAAEFGKEGDKNGVVVKFGNITDTGQTLPVIDISYNKEDDTVSFEYKLEVTIRNGLKDNLLLATIAHEGRHVGDAKAFLDSISPDLNKFNPSLQLTKRETEINAYRITHEIFRQKDIKGKVGACSECILGTEMSPVEIDRTIELILRTSTYVDDLGKPQIPWN